MEPLIVLDYMSKDKLDPLESNPSKQIVSCLFNPTAVGAADNGMVHIQSQALDG